MSNEENAILTSTKVQIKMVEEFGESCDPRAIINATAAMRYLEYGFRSEYIDRDMYNKLLNKLEDLNNKFVNNCKCTKKL